MNKRDCKLVTNKELFIKMFETFSSEDTDSFSLVYDNGSDEALSTAYFFAYVTTRSGDLDMIIKCKSRSFVKSYNDKMKYIQDEYSSSIDKLLINASRRREMSCAGAAQYVLCNIKTKVESDLVYISWLLGIYFAKLENDKQAS